MKRLLLSISFLLTLLISAKANHITGGQIYYTLTGQSGNNYTYSVTLLLYRDHFSTGAQLDQAAAIAIFDKASNAMVWNGNIQLAFIEYQNLTAPDPCISNPPTVYYDIGHYTFSVTLPATNDGYIIAYQRCCRIQGISNLYGSSGVGATYTAEIPGTSNLSTAPANNSAHFFGIDTVVVCHLNYFTYNFGAFDADGDSLAYYFCDAYQGGSTSNAAPNPPSPPPYATVPYASPFGGMEPLGSSVTINQHTGLVSGTAPDVGIYVVTVCVSEFRNGILIATQRKDLQIKVADCSIAAAVLPPITVNCDSYTTTFTNGNNSPLINSYFWNFGDPASGTNDSSTLASPTHVFTDTGLFTVTLITNRGQTCSDTGYTTVKIFPGFFAGFMVPPTSGTCINHPTQFIDTTKTVYGVVNSWSWNFGVPNISSDTSHLQNPSYTYANAGTYNAQLIVTCSKGCVDTVISPITIYDKPPIGLAFGDTLICHGDNVQIHATGNGSFSWTPLINISNPNSANPTVSPPATTTYYVTLNDNGCINNDSVKINVVNFVTLHTPVDTSVCTGDPAQLYAVSDGLQFLWSPAASLTDPTIINPIATPATTTTYQVTATIGSCHATDFMTVRTIPYPSVNTGPDTTICFNTIAQLHAIIQASHFTWTPSGSLNDPNSLNPLATPGHTTTYVLTVTDTLGCPKPKRDTIVVNVRPKINAFAGHDTAVVVGQPLQLFASGGTNYLWSPATSLNNFTIANPVAVFDRSLTSIRYRVLVSDEMNCIDSAFVTVRIFQTDPQIFVPTAFTPNGDGLNDVFRPLGVGIKKFEYFRIYNRWGQLVFSSTTNEEGWDGKIAGKVQSTNTFVWIVKGIDYLDRPFFKKGLVTLIR